MALRLIVMRHAKSSWKSGAVTDHERPLNKRGRRDAPRIGERLSELGWIPDRVISSDSQRTRETWAGLADEFGDDIDVAFTSTLYHGGVYALMDELADVPDTIETVLVLGHNPGWEEAVGWLSGEAETMTTANAAMLSTDAISWSDAVGGPRQWTLEQVLRPKEL